MSFPAGFPPVPKFVQLNVRSDVQVAEGALVKLRLSTDVFPMADFRARIAAFISLLGELELLRDVRCAEDDASQAHVIEQERVENRLRSMLGR